MLATESGNRPKPLLCSQLPAWYFRVPELSCSRCCWSGPPHKAAILPGQQRRSGLPGWASWLRPSGRNNDSIQGTRDQSSGSRCFRANGREMHFSETKSRITVIRPSPVPRGNLESNPKPAGPLLVTQGSLLEARLTLSLYFSDSRPLFANSLAQMFSLRIVILH